MVWINIILLIVLATCLLTDKNINLIKDILNNRQPFHITLMNGSKISCTSIHTSKEGGGLFTKPTLKAILCDGKIYNGSEVFDYG